MREVSKAEFWEFIQNYPYPTRSIGSCLLTCYFDVLDGTKIAEINLVEKRFYIDEEMTVDRLNGG